MTATYDVVVAGSGHNALITACYLAKAGLKVCVAERKEKAGGSVATSDKLTVEGFHQDVCSVSHSMFMANPIARNDELELFSKFGLKYAQPEKMTVLAFDDGSMIEFYSDLDRTCESIARISPKDAENYRRFIEVVDQSLDMVVMGMFGVPADTGMQTMMLDSSPEGQEMLRLQSISAWDLICEWIEHPKVRIALARYASEAMLNPFDNGTGFGFYIILPYTYRFGAGIAVGGSGSLADALVRCFEHHGGTLLLNSQVREILIEDGEARGLVLDSGETIRASRAVVAGLHVKQIFPKMVPGFELPAGFQHRLDTAKHSDFQPMTVHLALKEPIHFTIGGERNIDDFFWVERCHSDVEEFRKGFMELQSGVPNPYYSCWIQQFRADPTRIPEGKGSIYIYAFMPYDVKGGVEKWDEIGSQIANKLIDDLKAASNLTDDNIMAMSFMTPLDISRYNTALVKADIMHIGAFNWQLGGNRPVPGYGQYRMPVPKLYLSCGSAHPGGGVTGAPGRNSTQVIFEDLGLDFDKVIGG